MCYLFNYVFLSNFSHCSHFFCWTNHVFICFSSYFKSSDTFFSFPLLYLNVVPLNYMKMFRYQVENLWEGGVWGIPISSVVFLFCARLLFYNVESVYRITNFLTLFCVLINWTVLFVS